MNDPTNKCFYVMIGNDTNEIMGFVGLDATIYQEE